MEIEMEIPQMMIKDTMEPLSSEEELTAILQYVSTENGWGEVLSSVVDSTNIEQDGNTIYTTLHYECKLEGSLISEITLATKGYLDNEMYWIDEITIDE